MATGLSLHIGLRRVAPAVFTGVFPYKEPKDNDLKGCDRDATEMAALASSLGYTVMGTFLNDAAQFDPVKAHMKTAASTLGPGDIFFVTFSGHGNQITDSEPNVDEDGGQDDTWVFFDQEVRDDTFAELWLTFDPGVRIVVVLDSCSSGTAIAMLEGPAGDGPLNALLAEDLDAAEEATASTPTLTDQINSRGPVVLLLASSPDGGTTPAASDELSTSPYTTALLDTFKQRPFSNGYEGLHSQIQAAFPLAQLYVLGPQGADFRGFITSTQPFQI
jgi:hypothetical protein